MSLKTLCDPESPCDDEGRLCEVHLHERMAEFSYLRGMLRHQVIDDAQSREERDQELRDAGRGHLVRP